MDSLSQLMHTLHNYAESEIQLMHYISIPSQTGN